jgi:hypothetical protein
MLFCSITLHGHKSVTFLKTLLQFLHRGFVSHFGEEAITASGELDLYFAACRR